MGGTGVGGEATTRGTIVAVDGTRLAWEQRGDVTAAPAIVVVLHGFGEHLGRYDHVVGALVASGLATLGYDMRGHGASSGRRGHVRRFTDYVDDLRLVLERARGLAAGRPVLAVAHSNGGLILLRLLVDDPAAVDGAVVSSPYLGLAAPAPAAKVALARIATHVLPTLALRTGLTPDMLTADRAIQERTAADPLCHGVATPRWFTESLAAHRIVHDGAAAITTPLLVLIADADRVADAAATRAVVARIASADLTVRTYPEFGHELFNEIERERPLGEAIAWLTAHAEAR